MKFFHLVKKNTNLIINNSKNKLKNMIYGFLNFFNKLELQKMIIMKQ
jgi:hypothetical protein